MPLNLTFIPAIYRNKDDNLCKILSKENAPPQNSSFFVAWGSNITDFTQLEEEIQKNFPQIPVQKLLSCKIQLVTNNPVIHGQNNKKYYPIHSIIGKIMPLPPMIKLLFQLQIIERKDRTQKSHQYSDSIKTWAYLSKFTIEILERGNFVPILEEIKNKRYEGQWNLLLKTEADHNRFNKLIQNATWASYNLPIDFISTKVNYIATILKEERYPKTNLGKFVTNGIWHPSFVFTEFINSVGDFLIRSFLQNGFIKKFAAMFNTEVDPIENACVLTPDSPWDLRFLASCITKNREFDIEKFCDTPIPNILRNWVQNAQGFSYALGVNLTFRLEYPESEKADWDLGYYIQPLEKEDEFIPLMDIWDGIITYQEEYKGVCDDENSLQEEILQGLGTARKLFPPIARSLEGNTPDHVKLSTSEVMSFLRQGQYYLKQAGFNVVLPEQFREQGGQRLTARMVIKSQNRSQRKNKPSLGGRNAGFDMDTMLNYKWEAKLGKEGEILTNKEFMQLAQAKEPLIFWRGQWILIDQEDMNALKPIFERQQQVEGKIPYSDALKYGLAGGVQLHERGSNYEVVLEGDFSSVVDQIKNLKTFEEIPTPHNFQGKLRPYQQTGLTWLTHMASFNFGVILADDMGLGKTVEVIAFLQHRKEQAPEALGSILVICPTSLLFNWKREINRFSPEFKVETHHGSDRPKDLEAVKTYSDSHKIVLTTYGTVRNDIGFLETIAFAGIVLDESQNIKNYKAQQTQAVMQLKSRFRIALSGTPVENRLMELWTLFQFLNPGLLGTRSEFREKFVSPIERFQDEEASQKLQKFISPFLLRRLKTDKNIIKDLPEKNEIKIFLELSPEQAQLYSQVVQQTMAEIDNIEQNQARRRGLILRLLMQTKQICNHPFQYLHVDPKDLNFNDQVSKDENLLESSNIEIDANTPTQLEELANIPLIDFIKSSYKLRRLMEMIDEVLEEGEKLIIFTQFKQMGDILREVIEEKYDFEVGWFHGGVPEKKRRALIDDFQSARMDSSPILILSLRAGGTGLNLTQASTVFHYDRWWNPAVEDQATDRAYRIGQTQRVNVYKFIATGTIEEKIDQMLEEKRDLAEKVIGAGGETWITELSNQELQELFSFSEVK